MSLSKEIKDFVTAFQAGQKLYEDQRWHDILLTKYLREKPRGEGRSSDLDWILTGKGTPPRGLPAFGRADYGGGSSGAAPSGGSGTSGGGKAFVNDIYQRGLKLGLNDPQARLMAAQAGLESRYGQSGLAQQGNNLFGMKAGPGWNGDAVGMPTKEQNPDGSWKTVTGSFRKYASIDDSIKDYAERLKQKWPDAYNAKTWNEAKAGLKYGQRGGYATDKNYGSKLDQIAGHIGGEAPVADQTTETATPEKQAALSKAVPDVAPAAPPTQEGKSVAVDTTPTQTAQNEPDTNQEAQDQRAAVDAGVSGDDLNTEDVPVADFAEGDYALGGAVQTRPQNYWRGGPVKKFADGGEAESEGDAEPEPAVQTAAVQEGRSAATTPAAKDDTDNESFEETYKRVRGGQSFTGMPLFKAIGDGLDHLKSAFGLDSATPNTAGAAQVMRGAGSASSDDVKAAGKAVDPDDELSPALKNAAILTRTWQYQMAKGNARGAQQTAAGFIQYWGQEAAHIGAVSAAAYDQGDYGAAAKLAVQAYNQAPNGRQAILDKINDDGSGHITIKDLQSGKTVHEEDFNKDQLGKFVNTARTGAMYYNEMARVAGQGKAEKTPLSEQHGQALDAFHSAWKAPAITADSPMDIRETMDDKAKQLFNRIPSSDRRDATSSWRAQVLRAQKAQGKTAQAQPDMTEFNAQLGKIKAAQDIAARPATDDKQKEIAQGQQQRAYQAAIAAYPGKKNEAISVLKNQYGLKPPATMAGVQSALPTAAPAQQAAPAAAVPAPAQLAPAPAQQAAPAKRSYPDAAPAVAPSRCSLGTLRSARPTPTCQSPVRRSRSSLAPAAPPALPARRTFLAISCSAIRGSSAAAALLLLRGREERDMAKDKKAFEKSKKDKAADKKSKAKEGSKKEEREDKMMMKKGGSCR